MNSDRERRTAGRVSAEWRDARGDQALPPLTSLGLAQAAADWHDRFLIRSDGHMPSAVFIVCGDTLRSDWDMERLGRNLKDALPDGLRQRFAEACQQALAKGAPVHVEGGYHDPDLRPVLFRCVMLPVQVPNKVGYYIYGGYSQKTAA
ncbi:MAG: hypothetical protein O2967_21805 [Proteobacteria bacterium]|nr:hypothetical protein [Pseudomonadota bacterium]